MNKLNLECKVKEIFKTQKRARCFETISRSAVRTGARAVELQEATLSRFQSCQLRAKVSNFLSTENRWQFVERRCFYSLQSLILKKKKKWWNSTLYRVNLINFLCVITIFLFRFCILQPSMLKYFLKVNFIRNKFVYFEKFLQFRFIKVVLRATFQKTSFFVYWKSQQSHELFDNFKA